MKRTWSAGIRVVTRGRRAIPHGWGSREGWGRARCARGRQRLRRSCGEVRPWRGPVTITLVVRVTITLAVGAGVVIPRDITSAITLVLAVRVTTAPLTHGLFPRLKYGPICVVCGELRVEKGKNICKRGGASTEAVVCRAAITTTAAILYTCLPAGVLSEKGRPQGHVCVEHVIGDGADNVIIFVIKRPKVIVNSKGVPARVGM